MEKITKEIIERARTAESPEALLTMAKENGVELTAEDAQRYFDSWNSSVELSDEELENAAGGVSPCGPPDCPFCGSGKARYIEHNTYYCSPCDRWFMETINKKGETILVECGPIHGWSRDPLR